jgi:membrane carboxypeptidase/penicillin-binding protein PbpC
MFNNGQGNTNGALASSSDLQQKTGVSQAYVIETNGLPGRDNGNSISTVHFSSAGVRTLGQRYAAKIYEAVYENYTPPSASSGITINWIWNGTSLLPSTTAQTVTVGMQVTLAAITTGYTSYQWYVDGNPITGATSNAYTFDTTGKSGKKYNLFVAAYSGTTLVNGDKVVITVQ